MNLDRIISVQNSITVFRDGDRCLKVFNEDCAKADVINGALNQARMEETTVTQEQFDAMLADWLRRQGEQPADGWAAPLLERAKAAGITDGTRPRSFATRQEAAAMVLAAQKLKDK